MVNIDHGYLTNIMLIFIYLNVVFMLHSKNAYMFAKKERKLEIYSNFQFGREILERYRSFFSGKQW